MLKRIEKHQLCVGMHVESMEGDWKDTPFTERRFVLKLESQVEQIKASRITGVYINTAKGADVPTAQTVTTSAELTHILPDRRRDVAATIADAAGRLEGMFVNARSGGTVGIDNVSSIVGNISEQIGDNPAILVDMTRLKSKDKVTFLHSVAVSALLVHFGRALKYDEATVRELGIAGLVHDIGKILVPTAILNKAGALSEHERRIVMSHPALGYDILVRQGDMTEMVLDICRSHHERMDGKGYPDGIPAAKLSQFVRMSAICDVYDAVTSIRPYKKPWSSSEALMWMLDRHDHFDRGLLLKFIFSLDANLTKGVAVA